MTQGELSLFDGSRVEKALDVLQEIVEEVGRTWTFGEDGIAMERYWKIREAKAKDTISESSGSAELGELSVNK